MTIRSAAFIALLALGLAPAAASAQATSDGDRARAAFEEGVRHYDRQEFDAALAAFETSFGLRPVPIVMFNIAQTLRDQGRYAEAIDAYARYLDLAGDTLPPDRRAAIRVTIDQLGAEIGTLNVTSDPSGAALHIDGRSYGTTPRPDLSLRAGAHTIELSLGTQTLRQSIDLEARRTLTLDLHFETPSTNPTLSIATSPTPAHVRLDGSDVGVAPVTRTLPPGTHRLELSAPGYRTLVTSIVLPPSEARTFDLQRESPSLVGRWYFWTGAGAVVATAIILAAVIASSTAQPAPIPGTGDPQIITALERR